MNKILYSFLLTSIAGISTMIGSILILFKYKNIDKIITSSLAFASGVMISVSILDLIPEGLESIKLVYNSTFSILLMLVFINIGIIISTLINMFLPNYNELYKIGIISMIAIILHNVPEGMITFITSNLDITIGLTLTIAIALHNIPEGISISIPIYYATNSKLKAFSYTFIAGLSEIFGAIIAFLFFKTFSNDLFIGFLSSIIAGIMLHISIFELIPTSFKYRNNKLTILFFGVGVLFMLTTHFLLN